MTVEEFGMALREGTLDLTQALNVALGKLKAGGTYAAVVKKRFSGSK